MDADYEIFEIAAVMRGFWLLGAEAYQQRSGTSNGEPLTPGYYQMNWPENIRIRRLELQAVFYRRCGQRRKSQATPEKNAFSTALRLR